MMAWCQITNRVGVALIATLMWALTVALTPAQAQDYPDFYGTIVVADARAGTVTIAVDRQQTVDVDVSNLGLSPWNEGAFAVDNVVTLRTQRVGERYVALGWEEARNGREKLKGT